MVRADGAVCAQPEEERTHGVRRFDVEVRVDGQAGVRDVVVNAHGEVVLRALAAAMFSKTAFAIAGREFLACQAIPAAEHADRNAGFGQRRHDIHVQRLARRARFLRAVHAP